MKTINYRVINKQGMELAGVYGDSECALATALSYYHCYSEEEDVKLMADRKTLIDFKE